MLDLSVPEAAGGHPEEVWRRSDHGQLQQTQQDQQPLPASVPGVDQVLGSLGKGRVLFLFDLVSSFHEITALKDTVPLTAFCTPTGLYGWLVMPQGSSASPGWFFKVIHEVIRCF